jgi:hypothetical protein
MRDPRFRCRHCKKVGARRSPEQCYCGSEACQKARKNAWRRSKLRLDPDYRANQQASTKAWLASQGGSGVYYRRYRERRRQQLETGCADRADGGAFAPGSAATAVGAKSGAKSDTETAQSPVKSGRYRLVPCDDAKSDAIVVELSVIAGGWG